MTVGRGRDRTSVQVRRDTLRRLSGMRRYPEEPLDKVILRLMSAYLESHPHGEPIEVSS